MDNKYYTPEIQDLFVGYECEKVILDFSCQGEGCKPLGWEPYRIGDDANWKKGLREMETFILWNTKGLRTPYLTKEQIEKGGWETIGMRMDLSEIVITKGLGIDRPRGTYNIEAHKLVMMDGEGNTLYDGNCPSINEFIKICKLLGI